MRTWTMAGVAAASIALGSVRAAEPVNGTATVDLKVADDAGSNPGTFTGIGYGTNARLGRAWLVLHYRVEGSCPTADGICEQDAPVNVSVPGLAYDAAARRVVYRAPGAEPVICASVRRHGFPFGGESLEPTGACSYRLEKVDRFVDDGFSGRTDRREEIHFAVIGAGAAAGGAAGGSP